MNKIKSIFSATLAFLMALTITGCGNSSDNTEQSSYKDKIDVPTTDAIESIPDGAEKTLTYVTYDTSFLAGNAETPTNIDLFQQKGGKIEVIRTNGSLDKHNKLATLVLSDNVPDVTTYEEQLTVPGDVVLGLFQPIDSIVDFNSALWKDQKSLSEKFVVNGKHYVAPLGYVAASVLTYDQKVVDENGLTDPYTTYKEGNWDWDEFYDVMKSYIAGASGDEERYGLNGYYQRFMFASTGKTIVTYNEKEHKYENNIQDPDLAKAADFMYKIRKEGLNLDGWIGSAKDAFDANCLFYAMGQWASTSPEEDDEWMVVPMPKMPGADKFYTVVDMTTTGTLMWIKGSDKKAAMKCLLECSKIARDDEKLKKVSEEKFFTDHPYYSKKAYNVITNEIVSDQFTPLIDPGYGLTDVLSSDGAATNAEKAPIIAQCYKLTNGDGDNKVYSWSQIIARNSNIIDSELKTFNSKLSTFLKNDK